MLFECDPNDGESTIKIIENLTTNANRIQQQVLDEIIARNSSTEYLKAFLHGNNTSRDLFKKSVPVVEYEQLKPYIDRIANGEPSNIVSAHPITELLTRYPKKKLNLTIFLIWSLVSLKVDRI